MRDARRGSVSLCEGRVGFGSDALSSCNVTEWDGPPGKSIPGILQEKQQNLGLRRLLGSLLNTQLAPCFSGALPENSSCVMKLYIFFF